MKKSEPNGKEQLLWKEYRKAVPEAERIGCPEPNDLAAYLAGRASPEEIRSIEDHLAQCPSCLDAFLELRSLSRQELRPVPPGLGKQIRNLIKYDRPMESRRLFITYLRRAGGWAVAAGLVAAAGIGGFRLGRETVIGQKEAVETPFLFSPEINRIGLLFTGTADNPGGGR